jgi:dephospho-CoA kinase
MEKRIFITNGVGGCGKDTFANFLNKHCVVWKASSIDKVKCIAKYCGWDGGKTERDRKFLSDLKLLTTEYSDMPFEYIKEQVARFKNNTILEVLLIDIREPEEIERAKYEFDAETILIRNNRIKPITSNMADANVENYEYDYIIENNGTLEEFEETVKHFVDFVINEKECK